MRTTGPLQSLSFAVPTVVNPDARQNAGGRRRRGTWARLDGADYTQRAPSTLTWQYPYVPAAARQSDRRRNRPAADSANEPTKHALLASGGEKGIP